MTFLKKTLFHFSLSSLIIFRIILANPTDSTKLNVLITGTELRIEANIASQIKLVEIRIRSDRNNIISSITQISPYHSNPEEQKRLDDPYDRDIWYPVVDVELQRGIIGVGTFKNVVKGTYIFNGPYYHERKMLSKEIIFPGGKLHHWENSVLVEPKAVQMTNFYLSYKSSVQSGFLESRIKLLSEQWSGEISIYSVDGDERVKLASQKVFSEKLILPTYEKGTLLNESRLKKALKASVDFTLRSQIKDQQHPSNGGLFLFYDLDASLYRSYHWIWGWGPSVSMLLRAAEQYPDVVESKKIHEATKKIGEASLRFIWKDSNTPVNNLLISRWDRSVKWDDGYAGAVTPADALFLAGWAWVPLYELTKDDRYLKATQNQCVITESLFEDWIIPPHSYYFNKGGWSNWVIDETGFGVEGYAELYRINPSERIKNSGQLYVDRHIEIFEESNGLWGRSYNFETKKLRSSQHMTRGLAWALEGLLAAHRMMPDEGYLQRAKKMADHIMEYQLPSGAWNFRFDKLQSEVGISEKGTAIWSYFLYQLYHHTNEEKYLTAARKALTWCLNSIYDGPDIEANGSIVGLSQQSGVGYRRWFNVSCTYTSAFFGMAIMEELKLIK